MLLCFYFCLYSFLGVCISCYIVLDVKVEGEISLFSVVWDECDLWICEMMIFLWINVGFGEYINLYNYILCLLFFMWMDIYVLFILMFYLINRRRKY